MLFREAVANLEHYTQGTEKQHFFVGFNALNKSESQIIQEFVSQEAGIVIWDIDRCFFEDGIHALIKQTRHIGRVSVCHLARLYNLGQFFQCITHI